MRELLLKDSRMNVGVKEHYALLNEKKKQVKYNNKLIKGEHMERRKNNKKWK